MLIVATDLTKPVNVLKLITYRVNIIRSHEKENKCLPFQATHFHDEIPGVHQFSRVFQEIPGVCTNHGLIMGNTNNTVLHHTKRTFIPSSNSPPTSVSCSDQ